MLNIAIISGSNRIGKMSQHVANYIAAQLEKDERVEKVEMLDVREYAFPVMDERLNFIETPHPGLKEFSDKLKAADGVVMVSPEYNGGMAGSLKNTLDYFRKEYEGKPFGPVSVSSGSLGGQNAMNQMAHFIGYVGAYLLNMRLMVSKVNDIFDKDGRLKEERFAEKAAKFAGEMIWLTEAIKDKRVREGSGS